MLYRSQIQLYLGGESNGPGTFHQSIRLENDDNIYLRHHLKTNTMIDLVCGNNVDEQTAKFSTVYKGRKFCFCSKLCKTEFDLRPEKFIWMESTLKR